MNNKNEKIKLSPLRLTLGAVGLVCVIALIVLFFYFTNIITFGNREYSYKLCGSGIEITSYSGEDVDLKIPETINARNVVVIADKTFYDNDKIRDVKIPKTVKKIGSQAFSKCDSLENVEFYTDYAEFGDYVFEDSSVQSVALPQNMQKISRGMFKDCRFVRKVSFPDNLKEISDEAFSGCVSLGDMTIGEHIMKIGKNAFANNSDKFALSSVMDTITEHYAIKNGIQFKPCDSAYRKYIAYNAFEGLNTYNTAKVSASNGGMISFNAKNNGYYRITLSGGRGVRLKQEGESEVVCSSLRGDDADMLFNLKKDKIYYFKVVTEYNFKVTLEIEKISQKYAQLLTEGEKLLIGDGLCEVKAGTALVENCSSSETAVANVSSDITIKHILDYYIDSKNIVWYKINVNVGSNTKRDLWFKK